MTENDRISNDCLDEAPFMERLVFNNRILIIVLSVLATVVLGYYVLQMKPEASFLRMIPTYHPFIKNYLKYQGDLPSGNFLQICVEKTGEGDIFEAEYLETLRQIAEDVFFTPGVDRGNLKSLWSPHTRWREITEEGFVGDQVIPDKYDGSPESLEMVRRNVMRSGELGILVADNFKSSIIYTPLFDIDPQTRETLDYHLFSKRLDKIRKRHESDDIKIHVTGFAQLVGDLIDGLNRMVMFFFLALIIMLGLLYQNSRSFRVTILRGIKSMMAVIWQLGILHLMGYGLNPYSILVPFLVYAIGVSHGIQFFNAMGHEMTKGNDKYTAARLGYRLIYRPGLAALITDCIGFATLMIIRIGVIQDIAVGASIGIAVVAITDLTLLPVIMSYVGINEKTVDLLRKREAGTDNPVWSFIAKAARPRIAVCVILVCTIGLAVGIYFRLGLKTGDLDPGAPELRPGSRYNRDNAFINENYSVSSDLFTVILKTPEMWNSNYGVVVATDRLDMRLSELEGVQNVLTQTDYLKKYNSAYNEGNLKWVAIPRMQKGLDHMSCIIPKESMSGEGDLTPLRVYLFDHKAETLESVVEVVEKFASENNTETYQFLMAAGNAGIEAATNIEVEKALIILTLLVYAAVFFVCYVTYRSIRGSIIVVTPLVLTSVLCEAIMAKVGIGIKVATLPVIAVGVGIGVDYGIYIYNKVLVYQKQGYSFTDGYYHVLNTTGRAVTFTGITLGIGVATWIFSPIKFQADMGFLLIFMFLWNMLGAMALMPAIARYLMKDIEPECSPQSDISSPVLAAETSNPSDK